MGSASGCLIYMLWGKLVPGWPHVYKGQVMGPTIVHVGPLVVHVVAIPHLLCTLVLELDRVNLVDVLVNQATKLGGLAATFRGDGDHVDEFLQAHSGGTGGTCKLEHFLRDDSICWCEKQAKKPENILLSRLSLGQTKKKRQSGLGEEAG